MNITVYTEYYNLKRTKLYCFHHLIGVILSDKRLSRFELSEVSLTGGPKISQKRRVSSAPADTTVNPSGLYKTYKKLV